MLALAQTTTAFRRAAVGLVRSSSKWHVPGLTAILGILLGRRWGTFHPDESCRSLKDRALHYSSGLHWVDTSVHRPCSSDCNG